MVYDHSNDEQPLYETTEKPSGVNSGENPNPWGKRIGILAAILFGALIGWLARGCA